MTTTRFTPSIGATAAAIPRSVLKMSANRLLGMAASAIRDATQRPWLTTFAPILISFTLRFGSAQFFIGSGVATAYAGKRRLQHFDCPKPPFRCRPAPGISRQHALRPLRTLAVDSAILDSGHDAGEAFLATMATHVRRK